MKVFEEISLNKLTADEFLKLRKPFFSILSCMEVRLNIDSIPYTVTYDSGIITIDSGFGAANKTDCEDLSAILDFFHKKPSNLFLNYSLKEVKRAVTDLYQTTYDLQCINVELAYITEDAIKRLNVPESKLEREEIADYIPNRFMHGYGLFSEWKALH